MDLWSFVQWEWIWSKWWSEWNLSPLTPHRPVFFLLQILPALQWLLTSLSLTQVPFTVMGALPLGLSLLGNSLWICNRNKTCGQPSPILPLNEILKNLTPKLLKSNTGLFWGVLGQQCVILYSIEKNFLKIHFLSFLLQSHLSQQEIFLLSLLFFLPPKLFCAKYLAVTYASWHRPPTVMLFSCLLDILPSVSPVSRLLQCCIFTHFPIVALKAW